MSFVSLNDKLLHFSGIFCSLFSYTNVKEMAYQYFLNKTESVEKLNAIPQAKMQKTFVNNLDVVEQENSC